MEAARITALKRVVVSSSSVLNHYLAGGDDQGNFGREEAFPRPTTFYSATNQAVESLGLNYAKWCGIEFAGLRYGAVFGPWSGAGGGGPSNVIREAMKNALAGREAVVPPGAMEWVYSKDAARGTVLALDAKDLGSGIFNTSQAVVVPAYAGTNGVTRHEHQFGWMPASRITLPKRSWSVAMILRNSSLPA